MWTKFRDLSTQRSPLRGQICVWGQSLRAFKGVYPVQRLRNPGLFFNSQTEAIRVVTFADQVKLVINLGLAQKACLRKTAIIIYDKTAMREFIPQPDSTVGTGHGEKPAESRGVFAGTNPRFGDRRRAQRYGYAYISVSSPERSFAIRLFACSGPYSPRSTMSFVTAASVVMSAPPITPIRCNSRLVA